MAHIHTQALNRDWITVVVQGEIIGVQMAEIIRVRIKAAEKVRLLNHRE